LLLGSLHHVNEMQCTSEMTVNGVVVAGGSVIALDSPLHVKHGDRVRYGLLADRRPVAFVMTDTPIFDQARSANLNGSDVVGLAATEVPKPVTRDWSLKVVTDVEAEGDPRVAAAGPAPDLRLVANQHGVTIAGDDGDARGVVSLAITANVINLTINAVLSADASADPVAEITKRLLMPVRLNA
jgi:hypothetical protein